jgi:hypothetical protein
LIVIAALLAIIPTVTGCCSGHVRADAIAQSVARVTYRYEELVEKKAAEEGSLSLEKRVWLRSASQLRATVAAALPADKKNLMDKPASLWKPEPAETTEPAAETSGND